MQYDPSSHTDAKLGRPRRGLKRLTTVYLIAMFWGKLSAQLELKTDSRRLYVLATSYDWSDS